MALPTPPNPQADKRNYKIISRYNSNRISRFPCLPDDYVDQVHNSFVQAVKEIPQRPPPSLHAAQSEAEGDRDDQQPQHVHPI